MRCATFAAELDCADGAGSNTKYIAYMEAHSEFDRQLFPCFSHCNAVTELVLCSMMSGSFRRDLFDFIGYLRNSTNVLRILCVLESTLDGVVDIYDDEPPPGGTHIAEVFRHHMIFHVDEFSTAYDEANATAKPKTRSVDGRRKACGEFMDFSALASRRTGSLRPTAARGYGCTLVANSGRRCLAKRSLRR